MKEIVRQTLSILEDGYYKLPSGWRVSLGDAVPVARSRTKLYTHDRLPGIVSAMQARPGHDGMPPLCEVTSERTHDAALRLLRDEGCANVALLSFGAARTPAGRLLDGGSSQEADLARASALYECLLSQPLFYKANRDAAGYYYTDAILYAPGVPFFRAGDDTLLDTPVNAAVITAAAPFAKLVVESDPQAAGPLYETLARRIRNVLAVARRNGHRVLVLGAWGCGSQGYAAAGVANLFADILESDLFAGSFERIVFAVHDQSVDRANWRAFERRFAGMG